MTTATTPNPFSAPEAASNAGEYPKSRIALFAITAAIGCFADLVTKWYMFAQPDLRRGKIWWAIPDYAGFQLSLNEGALFGMGQGFVWLFAALSLVAAVTIPVWLFRYGAAADWGLTFALGCVMAGVLGNLYDRLGLHGEKRIDPARLGEPMYAVRDWILLQWGPQHRWPNFNIADSLLVLGAGYLLVKAVLEKPEEDESKPARKK